MDERDPQRSEGGDAGTALRCELAKCAAPVAAEATHQERLFRTVSAVNDDTSGLRGAAFFESLTERLAGVLEADITFVGRLGSDRAQIDIVALWADGQPSRPFSYALSGTPCEQVVANRVYSHARDVVQLFPEDTLLADLDIHAYVGVPLRDANGASIGILVGLFRREIANPQFAETVLLFFAPRVALEIQQDRSERQMRQRDEALRRLMDANVVGFVLTDPEGHVVDANDAFLQIVGYSRADLAAGRIDWHSMTPPEYAELEQAKIEELRRQGTAAPWEKEYLRADGTRVAVLVAGALLDHTGRMAGFVIDQTAQRRADEERRTLLAREQAALLEAREANQAKDRFLALLSHELRTPLSSIITATEILKRGTPGDDRARNALRVIDRNARHQARLIEDLLDLSRLGRGQLRLECVPVELDQLLAEALRTVQDDALAARVCLEARLQPGLWVAADPTRVTQIALNLLSNAVKFTPAGGCVTASLERVGPYARFEVTDTGIGIDLELSSRLFTPFVQGDRREPGRSVGLGIGLSIVRSLAELQGGRVSAQSPGPDLGSRFTVELPTIQPPAHASKVEPKLGGARLLLVEDNVDARETLASSLEMDGYVVVSCATGKEALAAVAAAHPDLILADLGLPDIDGCELLRRARRIPGCESIPALAVTAYGQAEDRERTREAGFAEHWVKPVDVAQLSNHLHELVVGSKPSALRH
jgi:PAS domain S-box-containing protein